MSVTIDIKNLKHYCTGYYGERIFLQLCFAWEVSRFNQNQYDEAIQKAVEHLKKGIEIEKTVTKALCLEAESVLSEISAMAKEYTMHCVAHAHMDMNWMWGYHETVSIIIDTLKTMLALMKEYPQFKFSQSQASVYEIVEKFDGQMLDEIKQRVAEGRWEVLASSWVEGDKNMPNGESLARSILYTKKYLSKLLDIDEKMLAIGFEPDTFGHNINIPEIYNDAGIKYYYHCRGNDTETAYRWKAPSGSELLVYRDPLFYLNLGPDIKTFALNTPELVHHTGIKTMLKFYGVGDHGGGPTRADIEKLLDMSAWPVYPNIVFGTLIEYFGELEKHKDVLPVITGEQNFIFTGCYTTQSRLKAANKIAEDRLFESELFESVSSIYTGNTARTDKIEMAWRNVLFSQFHDILPGSCMIDSREYSMGKFQETIAYANTISSSSLQSLSSIIDTTCFQDYYEDKETIKYTVSEGAGAGFGVADFKLPQADRAYGKNRIVTVFNPQNTAVSQPVEIVIWDYCGDKGHICVKDTSGNKVQHQIIPGDALLYDRDTFWGHTYCKVLIDAKINAYGYASYVLFEGEDDGVLSNVALPPYCNVPRLEKRESLILENEYLLVEFDESTLAVKSFIDKTQGKNYADSTKQACIFSLVKEDPTYGMTSWVVGRTAHEDCLNMSRELILEGKNLNGGLKKWIRYKLSFGNSALKVCISLDKGSRSLKLDVACDFREFGGNQSIPQLNFKFPLADITGEYLFDTAYGVITREKSNLQMPGCSFCATKWENSKDALLIISPTKYGFIADGQNLGLALIRAANDPDPAPEVYNHSFSFSVGIINDFNHSALIQRSLAERSLVPYVRNGIKEGRLAPNGDFLSVEGAILSMFKKSEQGDTFAMRVYNAEDKEQTVKIRLPAVKNAYMSNILEEKKERWEIKDGTVEFPIPAFSITTVLVEM